MGRKIILLSGVLASGVFLASCGGGGTSGDGTVSFYLTDALINGSPGTPQRVEVEIRSVSIVNSQTGASCEIFSDPQGYSTDLTDLAGAMRLLNVSSCDPGLYDRFVIKLSQNTRVMLNNTSYDCSIDPSLNPETDTTISCSGGECTVEVSVEDGGMSIVEGQNSVSLDFEVNDGDGDGREMVVNVNSSTGACSVAFEIEEIEPEEMDDHMRVHGKEVELEGNLVSNIDVQNARFDLTTRTGETFTVDCSNVSVSGLDQLLDRISQGNVHKIEVECSSIDSSTNTCLASELELKLKGRVLSLNTSVSPVVADLDLNGDGSMDVSVAVNEVEGNVSVGVDVEVEVTGHNGIQFTGEEMEEI